MQSKMENMTKEEINPSKKKVLSLDGIHTLADHIVQNAAKILQELSYAESNNLSEGILQGNAQEIMDLGKKIIEAC